MTGVQTCALPIFLFEAIAEETLAKIQNFNTQGLTNTAWAFATLGIKDDKLFRAISTESLEKIQNFNTQELANTAWAFATLGIKDDTLFRDISAESLKKIQNFNTQGLANTAWALMLYSLFTATHTYHSLLISLIRTLTSKADALSVENSIEIHQVLLYLRYFSSENLDFFPSSDLQAKINAHLKEQSKTPPRSSELHKFVQTALETLLGHKLSAIFCRGILSRYRVRFR